MDEAEYCDRIGWSITANHCCRHPDELKASVADDTRPDPSMEDAFIGLVEEYDKESAQEAIMSTPSGFHGAVCGRCASKIANRLSATRRVP